MKKQIPMSNLQTAHIIVQQRLSLHPNVPNFLFSLGFLAVPAVSLPFTFVCFSLGAPLSPPFVVALALPFGTGTSSFSRNLSLVRLPVFRASFIIYGLVSKVSGERVA